ncbi:MAG: tetratricopeptide repeat protein [Chloroflexota bacterium]
MLFLTYRHWTNPAMAIVVAKTLQSQGIPITTWVGDDQRTGAADARLGDIQQASAVLALCTPSMVYGWDDRHDAVRAELEMSVAADVPILPVLALGFTWDWASEHGYVPTSLSSLPTLSPVILEADLTASIIAQVAFFERYRSDATASWSHSAPPPSDDQLASEAALERAYLLGHQGDHAGSIASYTQGMNRHPTPAHYVGRGQTYLTSGDPQRAKQDFLQATRQFPDDPVAHNFLGSLAEGDRELEKARSHYNDTLAAMPDNEFALLRRANVYARLGQTAAAMADFDALLARFPDHADARVDRGDLLVEAGRLDEALSDFYIALQAVPRHVGGLMSRGNALLSLNDYDGALDDYDAVIRIQPNDALAHYNRGLTRQYQQDYVGAVVDYTLAIQIKPDYGDAYTNRGVVQRAMGHVQQAIDDYTQSMKFNGENPVTLTNRANALCDIGKHRQGIRDYTRALALDPTYTKALANRAFTYRDMGKHRQALQDFEAYYATLSDPEQKRSIAAVIEDLKKKARRWPL